MLGMPRPVGGEEPVIGLGNHVARVGERRHPGSVGQLGVPSDVVGVQVGVDDDVDVGGVDLGSAQRAEEVGLQPGKSWHLGTFAVVAHTGVHDDGQPVDLNHPALHHHPPPQGVRIQERGNQQLGVLAPRLRRRLGEQVRTDVELPFHDPGDDGVAQPDAVSHRPTLRGGQALARCWGKYGVMLASARST